MSADLLPHNSIAMSRVHGLVHALGPACHSMRSRHRCTYNQDAPAHDAHPQGRILNKVSGAPGFWIGNVIVMAGVLLIMQAMLVEVAPKLNSGVACSWKPCARMRARATSGCNSARSTNPAVAIGSYPMFAL